MAKLSHWNPSLCKLYLRDILSPGYSPGKTPSLDTSFEAVVVSAGNTPLSKLTISDATVLTSALVHNISDTPSGYEAHYTALMRHIW